MESVEIDLNRMREVASGCGWTFGELAAFYAPRAQAEVDEVRAALATGDVTAVARLTHGAAGSSATIGMDSMAQRFRAISAQAVRVSKPRLEQLVADVDRHLQAVLTLLAALARREL